MEAAIALAVPLGAGCDVMELEFSGFSTIDLRFFNFFLLYYSSVYHMMMTAPLTHTCTDFVNVVRRFSIAKKLD